MFSHEFLKQIAEGGGLPALFALLIAAGLGLPLPEDIPITLGGILAHERTSEGQGNAIVALFLATLYAGVLIGDSIVYWVGWRHGESVLSRPRIAKLMTPARVARVRGYYERYGNLTVFIARNVAGVRFPTFLMAGVTRMGYLRFIFWDGLSGLVSVPFWFCLGFFFAQKIDTIKKNVPWVIAGLIVVVVAGVSVKKAIARRNPTPPPPADPSPVAAAEAIRSITHTHKTPHDTPPPAGAPHG